MIHIIDNIINDYENSYCLDLFDTLDFDEKWTERFVKDIEVYLNEDKVINEIKRKLVYEASKYKKNICLDWSELDLWPEYSHHNLHLDKTSSETVFTSVLYFNSQFRGGETFFLDGTVVAPVEKRAVFFDGTRYPHGVRPVLFGVRKSMVAWYKLNEKV